MEYDHSYGHSLVGAESVGVFPLELMDGKSFDLGGDAQMLPFYPLRLTKKAHHTENRPFCAIFRHWSFALEGFREPTAGGVTRYGHERSVS
jgi:hypothetical protein